jgi:diguanylate cyclase (GGDEF)-like protein
MNSLLNISLQRGVVFLFIALCVVVGGTWTIVKIATEHLLYQDATSTARNWAQLLGESVNDLEQIAAGEQPSNASMMFFQWAQKAGQVFRYEIYNREGYSQLVSEHGVRQVGLSKFSADAVRSLAIDSPVVDVREGTSPDRPSFFAQAYVPVLVNGSAVAIVAAYVDQTEKRDNFYSTFLLAGALLCLLTAVSFSLPAIAWYRRTKEKQQADRRIRFLAHHDALTGLANRPHLIEKLDSALTMLSDGSMFAVHFLDLDRFKEVNDTLGHDGGDFMLKAVAERLRAVTRHKDVIARLGGDEFIVVQPDVVTRDEAEAFASRLTSAIAAPLRFKDHEIMTTGSVGIAIAPADGSTPERLLKSADLALYASKAEGRNCIRLFMPEMDAELQARIELERVIRDAVVHNRFELHYQPLFEMSDRRLIGFEALIRLPKQDGTLVPPMTFIPVAEEMRLLEKIGAWVMREACLTAATWPSHLTVAVNLSPSQFAAGSVSEVVASALAEAGLEPHRLELEITEALLLRDSEAIMLELRTLKAMGVAIVMDDFGTGYSSLSYLWRFPFNKIKIDRSFMQAFDGAGREAETVVKTIIALGRELHMRVTVEGIETAEQAAFLDGAAGDQAQGFYFGRPVPAAEIAAVILTDFHHRKVHERPPLGSDGELGVVNRSS